ncbi:MAG: hypothetical protein LC734_05595 [Acidobacteria bacterium]|nr:hypothetical protein [Acidobacteriota bacterium]
MSRNWIEFENGQERPLNGLYVTINDRGYIKFCRGVFEKMNKPAAVALLWDPLTDTIGVRPCPPLMPNAFGVKCTHPSGTQIIYSRPFCKEHDIRIEGTVRFRNAAIEEGILILPLNQLIIVKKNRVRGKGPRGPRKKKPLLYHELR